MRLQPIVSRKNPLFKELRALATDPREGRAKGLALLDGIHLLDAYQRSGGHPQLIAVTENGLRLEQVSRLLEVFAETEVVLFSESLFNEISGVVTPVGVLAVIDITSCPPVPNRSGNGGCVMLDAVQDSGNVGSILRSAAASGVRQVLLGRGCAGAWTPKVIRAAQGAHFTLDVEEQVDLVTAISNFKGLVVATVVTEGNSLFDAELTGEIAWLFGNEGAGLNPSLLQMAGRKVCIPMHTETESLNVAAAAAVCLFEERRQKLLSGKRS